MFVHELLRQVTTIVSSLSPQIKSIEYFSDGCAGQYKNYKNMLNLCLHQLDFKFSATWSFFATSHGKSPYDGVGGTVKRLAARVSLQRPLSGQILSSQALFDFCKSNIEGIQFFFLPKSILTTAKVELAKRINYGSTIPGTRSFHHFIPVSENAIGYKRTSEDSLLAVVHHFSDIRSSAKNFKLYDFVACKYNSFWWIGIVNEICGNNDEACVKFMSPHGPSSYFSLPSRDDICWVPVENIVCVLSPPTAATSTGRKYSIAEADLAYMEKETLEVNSNNLKN